jgi:hypothetical protein
MASGGREKNECVDVWDEARDIITASTGHGVGCEETRVNEGQRMEKNARQRLGRLLFGHPTPRPGRLLNGHRREYCAGCKSTTASLILHYLVGVSLTVDG